jgi:hypothetical protein
LNPFISIDLRYISALVLGSKCAVSARTLRLAGGPDAKPS